MADSTLAGEWMKANGHDWKKPKCTLIGKAEKKRNRRNPREYKACVRKGELLSIKSFVEANRTKSAPDCVFVPYAQEGAPAQLEFCDKLISAARYMVLLTLGTPKYEGAVVRHLCGNGHLSCVNPAHLVWGDVSDNVSDQMRHKAAGGNIQDRIHSVTQ